MYTDKDLEELLNRPYWIIDILPIQVPKDSPGQYFAVEDYFLKERMPEIKKKHIDLILKLNCYMDIAIGDDVDPAPSRIASIMNERHACIMVGDSMIVSEPDDTYLTLYDPDEQLLGLVKEISRGEGLFVWKGKN